MKIRVNSGDLNLRYTTRALRQRMLSPLCGLDQRVSFMLRGRLEPRFMTAGAELAGVHVLRGQPRPRTGSYHIGGSGVWLEEALIRALGETIERYSQLVGEVSNRHELVWATYDELVTADKRTVKPGWMRFFSEEQLSRVSFPFQPFDPAGPMNWVRSELLTEDSELWVPAQLVLVGYNVRQAEGEPWLLPAVTTGSAAHTNPEHALRNALLELVQIDSAMGHWYSGASAPQIIFDERCRSIERLIRRYFHPHQPTPKFYWLPNPDLVGFSVACVIRDDERVPAAAVGLGSDLRLLDALYKALLEAVGVVQLAKLTLLDQSIGEEAEGASDVDPERIYDLDQNVALYALHRNRSILDAKFDDTNRLAASDLPSDTSLNLRSELRLLVDGFHCGNKDLVIFDLTTPDIRQLGFTALRVWSPDTLSLSLPSAPPANHPRFSAYGGFRFDRPHPYP